MSHINLKMTIILGTIFLSSGSPYKAASLVSFQPEFSIINKEAIDDVKTMITGIDLDQVGIVIREVKNTIVGNLLYPTDTELAQLGAVIREVKNTVLWNLLYPADIIKYAALMGTGIGTVGFLGYYGPRILYNYIALPRPAILLPGSKIGFFDRSKRWVNGYRKQKTVFSEEVHNRLNSFLETAKEIKKSKTKKINRMYRNLLLWGPPGTGKTLFATVLADELDMDFFMVTAASLLQKDAGVQFLNDFVKRAQKSSYGAILFIDEADALFVDRDMIDISTDRGSEHYKFLNHFLALVGSGSSDFMIIAATNHAYLIDGAMGRRFQERIFLPLPDEDTRKKLINLYVNELIFSEHNGLQYVSIAKQCMNEVMIQSMAAHTNGLSGAEIKDIIISIQYAGLHKNPAEIFNKTEIEKLVAHGIEKRQQQEQDKKEREKRLGAVT